ncbi:probable 1-acylglycerol-3-phosphate O-acyltransferase [Pistacia vera]|uniref:probable 1-acylglycerol-3-phosphate O-acyltransferase n=1 Tax=Pistacia vera TaxID=55513 RepID=UPI001262B318|nr:probable 1-acylglycerol-3-phosphate O-acyltransferase [Pistacia vera]
MTSYLFSVKWDLVLFDILDLNIQLVGGEIFMSDLFLSFVYSASDWKVPTTFIYGVKDWMNYQGAQEARKHMKVPCEIIRVPQAGHFVFIDNPNGFHAAMFYACRRFLSPDPDNESFPEGLSSA